VGWGRMVEEINDEWHMTNVHDTWPHMASSHHCLTPL
jgi:hypothetical protein